MSDLKRMMNDLGQQGVTYKRLDEVCKLEKGKTAIQKAVPGEYPLVVTTSQRKNCNEYQFDEPTVCVPLVSSRGHGIACLNEVYYQEGKFALGNILCGVTPLDSSVLSAKFLNLYLNYKKDVLIVPLMKGGANVSLTVSSLGRVIIPIPPLNVQNEIVRVLETVAELTEELEDELSMRKKQYQYYINYLFENQEAEQKLLSEVGILTRGKRFVHADAVEIGVPCVHYGEIYTYYRVHSKQAKSHIRQELKEKMRYAVNGDVIIVGAGENNTDIGIGVAWEGEDAVAVHDACYTLKHNQNPRYLSYYFRSDSYHNQIKKYVSEGKICSISAQGLGNALIPLPSIDEQNRIVKILDEFEKLCYDNEIGIMAEIERRKKQFEFFCWKLFQFEKREGEL